MIPVDIIFKYFPSLSDGQKDQFTKLMELYVHWNNQINVVSRKDIDLLYERHVLHSLGIAKVVRFESGQKVMDVGTGGGFPGIPLAILFPETHFHLVDSIGKKIKVVKEVAAGLGLKNVSAEHERAEKVNDKFNYIVSRAVTEFPEFYSWVKDKFLKDGKTSSAPAHGIFYLKGGDLKEEFGSFYKRCTFYDLKTFFEEDFFETKKVVYMPVG
jgi:16S rRNA (guanine527-N7)-methyltransferase